MSQLEADALAPAILRQHAAAFLQASLGPPTPLVHPTAITATPIPTTAPARPIPMPILAPIGSLNPPIGATGTPIAGGMPYAGAGAPGIPGGAPYPACAPYPCGGAPYPAAALRSFLLRRAPYPCCGASIPTGAPYPCCGGARARRRHAQRLDRHALRVARIDAHADPDPPGCTWGIWSSDTSVLNCAL